MHRHIVVIAVGIASLGVVGFTQVHAQPKGLNDTAVIEKNAPTTKPAAVQSYIQPMTYKLGNGKMSSVGVKVTVGGSVMPRTVVTCGGSFAGKVCTVETHTCATMAVDMFNCCGQREVESASCDKKVK